MGVLYYYNLNIHYLFDQIINRRKMKNLINSTLKSLAVACLLYNINPFEAETVKADQPVHCLREQLFGVWNFHVSKD